MSEVLRDLVKPSWWLTVLVAGLLVNLMAAYVKPVLDRIAGRVSERRRAANQHSRAAFEARVARVAGDREYRTQLQFDKIEARVHEVGWLPWTVFSAFWAERLRTGGGAVLMYVWAGIAFTGALRNMTAANTLGEVLDAPEQRHAVKQA